MKGCQLNADFLKEGNVKSFKSIMSSIIFHDIDKANSILLNEEWVLSAFYFVLFMKPVCLQRIIYDWKAEKFGMKISTVITKITILRWL